MSRDEGNGYEVSEPEPPVIDPSPPEPVTCDNQEKATHDKEHDPEVKEENCISEKLVRNG